MAWTPVIPFVSGVYPAQVLPSNDFNLLMGNVGVMRKSGFSFNNLTPPTAITQATSGTWTTIDFIQDQFIRKPPANRPYMLQAVFSLTFSAAVANKVLFAWFENTTISGGIAGKFTANGVNGHLIVLNKWINPASTTLNFKWQIESATPNLTASMLDGYRLTAIPL